MYDAYTTHQLQFKRRAINIVFNDFQLNKMTSYTAISFSKYVGDMNRLGIDHTGLVWYNYMLVGFVEGHFRFLLYVFTLF